MYFREFSGRKSVNLNNRSETFNDLKMNYFPVFFKGFAKSIGNYGSPEF